MISSAENPAFSVRSLWARVQMRTFESRSDAWPFSSKAITTAVAPYRRTRRARRRNSASPSFREIEFTMPLPWRHLRPASSTLHFEESTITGTRAISGSVAIRRRNRPIAASPSIKASSTFTSIRLAPFSTCWRAIATASSQFPALIARENRGEPVILVRSPMTRNDEADFFIRPRGPRDRSDAGRIPAKEAGAAAGPARI